MRDVEDALPDPEDLELPDDIDPGGLAEPREDELIAEEGADLDLDPDLAMFAARDELPFDDDGHLFDDDHPANG